LEGQGQEDTEKWISALTVYFSIPYFSSETFLKRKINRRIPLPKPGESILDTDRKATIKSHRKDNSKEKKKKKKKKKDLRKPWSLLFSNSVN